MKKKKKKGKGTKGKSKKNKEKEEEGMEERRRKESLVSLPSSVLSPMDASSELSVAWLAN